MQPLGYFLKPSRLEMGRTSKPMCCLFSAERLAQSVWLTTCGYWWYLEFEAQSRQHDDDLETAYRRWVGHWKTGGLIENLSAIADERVFES
jgi:hypothetical protein